MRYRNYEEKTPACVKRVTPHKTRVANTCTLLNACGATSASWSIRPHSSLLWQGRTWTAGSDRLWAETDASQTRVHCTTVYLLPFCAVWLACFLSFLLGLPSLGSSVAFTAATSVATIGLYISIGIPIALRVIYRKRFVRGPFHLQAFSLPVAIAASTWVLLISIIFILPTVNVRSSLCLLELNDLTSPSLSTHKLSTTRWLLSEGCCEK